MDFGLLTILSVAVPVIILLGIIIIKMIRRQEIPDSRYTPFDYITGHSKIEFHEQKEVKEEKDEEGDDKNKRVK